MARRGASETAGRWRPTGRRPDGRLRTRAHALASARGSSVANRAPLLDIALQWGDEVVPGPIDDAGSTGLREGTSGVEAGGPSADEVGAGLEPLAVRVAALAIGVDVASHRAWCLVNPMRSVAPRRTSLSTMISRQNVPFHQCLSAGISCHHGPLPSVGS